MSNEIQENSNPDKDQVSCQKQSNIAESIPWPLHLQDAVIEVEVLLKIGDNEHPCGRQHGPEDCEDQHRATGNDFAKASDYHCGKNLAPVPEGGAAATEFFQKIAREGFIAFAECQVFQHPDCKNRRLCIHARPPFVIRKKRFALPPRSGVGSPRLEEMSPLASKRSNAAYTLPTETSLPRC